MQDAHSLVILMAEDDPDDCEIARTALRASRLANDLRFVENGEQLMDYLLSRGAFAEPGTSPRPGVILLGLNMVRKDGWQALAEIRANPDLRRIPVVILTTSKTEGDVARAYDLGANSFIVKPVTFMGLVDVMKSLGHYWFEIVRLPLPKATGG